MSDHTGQIGLNPSKQSNNFDLIRLFAAIQVAIIHMNEHLQLEFAWASFLSYLPGVPIFFFISGFLIIQSWARAGSLSKFFINRALRIFPALWACVALSAISVFAVGYLEVDDFLKLDFWAWIIGQSTIVQFYNPQFLRGYGVGVVNGSLWTIAVELQFYVLTPLLYFLWSRKLSVFFLLLFLSVAFGLYNAYLYPPDNAIEKLFSVTFMPWVWMFMLGVIVSTSEAVKKVLGRISLFWVLLGYVFAAVVVECYGMPSGNYIGPIQYALLAAMCFKFAYLRPDAADHILKRNDFSYGIYIYHMPVINLLIYLGLGHSYVFLISAVLTVVLSVLSWNLVERPALRFKPVSLRAV